MQEAKISIDVHTRKLQSLLYRFVDQTGYRHIFFSVKGSEGWDFFVRRKLLMQRVTYTGHVPYKRMIIRKYKKKQNNKTQNNVINILPEKYALKKSFL